MSFNKAHVDSSTPIETDILIAGGGPCGLMLANELGRRGIDCLLVDPKPGTAFNPQANATQARTMEQASSTDEPEALPSDAPGPPDLIAAAEAGSRVRCALEQLGSQERWVLGLAYYRDLSHSQIAGETGLPLGTVKSLILRAQARLRKMLVQPESFQP